MTMRYHLTKANATPMSAEIGVAVIIGRSRCPTRGAVIESEHVAPGREGVICRIRLRVVPNR